MSQLSPLHISFAIYIAGMTGIGFAAWHCLPGAPYVGGA
jgi:hypothetical protein